ncbi:MAG: hypothetical protein ACPGWS_07420 [Solirubrobacterales bacterium]
MSTEQTPDGDQPTKSISIRQPQQRTINVVGAVVIATLIAIVIAQATGNNSALTSNQQRLGGPPNAQFQPPGSAGGMGKGGMPQGNGRGGPPPGVNGPPGARDGNGPRHHQGHDNDGENGGRDEDKKGNKDDNNSEKNQGNQSDDAAPRSRAS